MIRPLAQRISATIALAIVSVAEMWASPPAEQPHRRFRPRSERGDVPGWVMITMMTAIVVIALIAVFRDAVLDAVTNAFNSITGKD
jgi:hypothetical protein